MQTQITKMYRQNVGWLRSKPEIRSRALARLGALALVGLAVLTCSCKDSMPADRATLERDLEICEQGFGLDQEGALSRCLAAAETASRLGLVEEQVQALIRIGHIRYVRDELDIAMEVFTEARDLGLKADRPDMAALGAGKIGNMHQFCYGDLDAAAACHLNAVALAREGGDIWLQTKNLNNAASIRLAQGRLEEAARLLFEAIDVGRGHIPPIKQATLQCNLSATYLRLGDLEQAWQLIREADAIFAEHQEPRGMARVHVHRANLLMKENQLEEAEEELQLALLAQTELQDRVEVARILHLLGELETRRANFPVSFRYLGRSLAEWRQLGDRASQAKILVALARAHLRNGDLSRASTILSETVTFCRAGGFELELRQAYEMLAELSELRGDSAAALAWMRQAEELAELKVGEVSEEVLSAVLERERAQSEETLLQERQTFLIWWATGGLLASVLLLVWGINTLRSHRSQRQAAQTIERQSAALAWQKEQLDALLVQVQKPKAREEEPRYQSSRLTEERAKHLLPRLVSLVEEEQLFFDPELTLEALAERLQVNRSYLSQAINEHLGQRFPDYLNGLRVKEAAARLSDPKYQSDSVLTICFAVGFNSTSAFYRAFKAQIGTTPSAYRRNEEKAQRESDEK